MIRHEAGLSALWLPERAATCRPLSVEWHDTK
jgi:hypothetical protein